MFNRMDECQEERAVEQHVEEAKGSDRTGARAAELSQGASACFILHPGGNVAGKTWGHDNSCV